MERKSKVYLIVATAFIALSAVISLLSKTPSINSGVLIPFALFFSSLIIFLTNLVPFSVMEMGTIIFVGAVIFNIIYKIVKKKFNIKDFLLKSFVFVSVLSFIFIFNFGIFYNNHAFYDLGKDITTEQVYDCALKLTDICNKNVNYEELSFGEVSKEVARTFKEKKEKPFNYTVPRPKASIFSGIMSYSYVSGMHIPFTGETLINRKMPSFTIPFSMAHETAHSMSVAREDEANFAAFYVLIDCDSKYLKFSAAAECLSFFLDKLYEKNTTLYNQVVKKLDYKVLEKYEELNKFLSKYDTITKDISEKINDTYLKSNGQESGTLAYGEVVTLITNYFNTFEF